MSAAHRIRQGLHGLFAFALPVDTDLATRWLSPPLLALFERQGRSEQRHSLNVLRSILAQGDTPADLALAALLHDVGKSRYPLAVWQKTLAVLTRRFAPAVFHRLSEGDPRRVFTRPFVVYVHHPAWGAELIAATGEASDDALWLVEHHQDDRTRWQDHHLFTMLKRLQMADDAN